MRLGGTPTGLDPSATLMESLKRSWKKSNLPLDHGRTVSLYAVLFRCHHSFLLILQLSDHDHYNQNLPPTPALVMQPTVGCSIKSFILVLTGYLRIVMPLSLLHP